MAHLGKIFYAPTGRISWLVQFRKRVYGKNREVKKNQSYNATFRTKKEALAFIDEFEHIFFLQAQGDVEYDRLMEMRERRFRHKLKKTLTLNK